MMGPLRTYLTFYKTETLKKLISSKLAFLIAVLNLSLGGIAYSFMQYGTSYIFYGLLLTLIPGLFLILYTAFVTHLVLKLFSRKSFIHTLIPFSLASVPAIFSFLPFVYYFCIVLALIVLVKGLSLQHHIKWYKALFAVAAVSLINYFILIWIGFLFGGSG